LAGAVAGTAILPGLGTAVGIKAGELTEKLFNMKPQQPARQQTRPGRQ
jgi:hypothetical protein